jgi:hypothetical protein
VIERLILIWMAQGCTVCSLAIEAGTRRKQATRRERKKETKLPQCTYSIQDLSLECKFILNPKTEYVSGYQVRIN